LDNKVSDIIDARCNHEVHASAKFLQAFVFHVIIIINQHELPLREYSLYIVSYL